MLALIRAATRLVLRGLGPSAGRAAHQVATVIVASEEYAKPSPGVGRCQRSRQAAGKRLARCLDLLEAPAQFARQRRGVLARRCATVWRWTDPPDQIGQRLQEAATGSAEALARAGRQQEYGDQHADDGADRRLLNAQDKQCRGEGAEKAIQQGNQNGDPEDHQAVHAT